MFVHLSFVSLHVVCKCNNIYILRFGKLNKLYYIKLFIMNKQFYFSSEYVAPEVEVISAVVEHGFSASLPGVTINPWEEDDDSLEF